VTPPKKKDLQAANECLLEKLTATEAALAGEKARTAAFVERAKTWQSDRAALDHLKDELSDLEAEYDLLYVQFTAMRDELLRIRRGARS